MRTITSRSSVIILGIPARRLLGRNSMVASLLLRPKKRPPTCDCITTSRSSGALISSIGCDALGALYGATTLGAGTPQQRPFDKRSSGYTVFYREYSAD